MGWRKTSENEDAVILATFQNGRQPLGSAVDAADIFNALSHELRHKICPVIVQRADGPLPMAQVFSTLLPRACPSSMTDAKGCAKWTGTNTARE